MTTLHQPTLRVVKILEALKDNENGLNISQLSKDCEISVGTLHPILKTLCKLNYLECDNKNYTLTHNSNSEIEQKKSIKIISFYVNELANKLKLGAQLGMLSGKNVIYVHKCEGDGKIILKTKVGDIANANATALGKSLLFDKTKEELVEIFKTNNLEKNTEKTIDNIEDLYNNISSFKRLGYTCEIGEFDDDFACFSAPIYKDDKVFAAISVTLLRFHLNDKKREEIIKNLVKYKNIIENQI